MGMDVVPDVVTAVKHPIRHSSAGFRCTTRSARVRVSVLYWAHNSGGLFDPELDRHVSWDVDLLSGYRWQSMEGAQPISKGMSCIKLIRGLKLDVVVCFGWASAAARLTILWCLLTGTPVHFYGDTSWQHTPKGPRQWLRRCLLRIASRFAAGAPFQRSVHSRLLHLPGNVSGTHPRQCLSH